jgi:hypothetical protein
VCFFPYFVFVAWRKSSREATSRRRRPAPTSTPSWVSIDLQASLALQRPASPWFVDVIEADANGAEIISPLSPLLLVSKAVIFNVEDG